MAYRVMWSNDHASDWLPGTFDTEAEATEAGEEWHKEMVAVDDDPESAADEYEYEVREVDGNGKPVED